MTKSISDGTAGPISHESFAEAYRAGFRLTVRFLLSKGASMEEAEDTAQTAWTRGWEARSQLLNPALVLPWVNTIAYHRLCSGHRRPGKEVPLSDFAGAADNSPAARADATKLLNQCSPRDRALLMLRYFDGLDMREIAASQGLTEIAVRVRIHRCQLGLRNKINRIMGGLWPGAPETQGA